MFFSFSGLVCYFVFVYNFHIISYVLSKSNIMKRSTADIVQSAKQTTFESLFARKRARYVSALLKFSAYGRFVSTVFINLANKWMMMIMMMIVGLGYSVFSHYES